MGRKDEEAVNVMKGDIKIRIKTKAIVAVIILAIILITGVIVAYSDWQLGCMKHDANDVPKPKIIDRR